MSAAKLITQKEITDIEAGFTIKASRCLALTDLLDVSSTGETPLAPDTVRMTADLLKENILEMADTFTKLLNRTTTQCARQ